FGLVGNILNAVVLSSPKFKDTTSFLLLSLSVVDFFVSATHLVFRMPNILLYFNPRLSYTFYCFYLAYVYMWNQIFLFVSIFYVSLVAVERMIAVCFPFHVARLVTRFRVRVITVLGFIFYAAINSPFLNMLYTSTYHDGNNVPYTRVSYTDFYLKHWDQLLYYRLIVTALFIYALPMILIIGSTVMITSTMALSWKNLNKLSNTNSSKRLKEMKSTKTALYVCLSMMIFILIPSSIFGMLSWIREDLFPTYRKRTTIIYYVMTNVFQFNSFVNFIIYVATSPKFSRQFKYLF
ncbi:unnamed protein product, partial [Lymnaea stagnalis]